MSTPQEPETVLSLLCSPDPWAWDPSATCSIKFNKDGTGLIRAGAELSIFIAAEFTWKPKDPIALSQALNITRNPSRKGTTLCKFEAEITLTTRVHPLLKETRDSYNSLNEQALTEAAFNPKTYMLTLEHGIFEDPSDEWLQSKPAHYRPPRYDFRLSFDKSPFPPRAEWKEAAMAPAEAMRFWDMREFALGNVGEESWWSAVLKRAGIGR